MQPSNDIRRLIEIMAALRDPVAGCPWDVEQTFASIAPFTIEEAYEVADAIERASPEDLREELGDLLLQVVFHARMAEEARHVRFRRSGGGDHRQARPPSSPRLWRRRRREPRGGESAVGTHQGGGETGKIRIRAQCVGCLRSLSRGALAGVPLALPALTRAIKLQEKAGKVGFDWNDVSAVLAKIGEEIAEVEAEIATGSEQSLCREVGDLIFAVVNLARHLNVDPESALRGANAKFERRFAHIEHRLAERGKPRKRQSRRNGVAMGRSEGAGAQDGLDSRDFRDSEARRGVTRRVTLPANAKRHPSADRFSLARATAPPTGKRRLTRSI